MTWTVVHMTYWQDSRFAEVFFFLIEMSSKMRSLDREVRGLKMEKEDIERVSFKIPSSCILKKMILYWLLVTLHCNFWKEEVKKARQSYTIWQWLAPTLYPLLVFIKILPIRTMGDVLIVVGRISITSLSPNFNLDSLSVKCLSHWHLLLFSCGSELEKRESKFLHCLIISGSSGGKWKNSCTTEGIEGSTQSKETCHGGV